MSTDDSKPGGLFSKVVRFMRPPAVHWSELETSTDDPLGHADKQVLRQTLERKRRNDFVRQREFEQLRRLRQTQADGAQALADASSLPASVQSSQSPADARAVTLKKIDAIEEQMSQQWWRNKQPADASTLPMYLLSSLPQPDSVHVPAAPATGSAAGPRSAGTPGFALTAPLDWNVDAASAPGASTDEPQRLTPATTFAVTEPLEPPDWSARPPSPSARPFVHDPDFEAAAIMFANGDAQSAEAGLLELLAQRSQPDLQLPVWQALFDLYRAAGMADRFEVLAIDFAARFERSAPLWFALSALRGWTVTPDVAMPGSAAAGEESNAPLWRWFAPARLTLASVAALQQAKAGAPAPWTLDWSALERIDVDALAPLERVFTEWAQAAGTLVFLDAAVLAQCLQALTVSGDRAAPEDGWRLRMAALRLMDQHDSFELVALDYCVTYEVSPPSWTPPRNTYLDGLAALDPDAVEPLDPGAAPPPSAGLAGCIDSDATPWLVALEAHARPGRPLVIDCAELIRVDFAAAGSVLNWAARMQAEGVALRFERLHQLVAVFFAMIGVGDHALLVPRTD